MDKRPIGYKPGQKYFMDQKVPKSKKYSHVKGTINTGKTIKDVDIISKHPIVPINILTYFRQQTSCQKKGRALL